MRLRRERLQAPRLPGRSVFGVASAPMMLDEAGSPVRRGVAGARVPCGVARARVLLGMAGLAMLIGLAAGAAVLGHFGDRAALGLVGGATVQVLPGAPVWTAHAALAADAADALYESDGPRVLLPLALGAGGAMVPTPAPEQTPEQTPEQPPADPLDAFFSLDAVHEVRIEADDHAVAALLERPRTYVHASVRIGDDYFEDVGLRLKGGAGSFVPLDGDYPPISGDGNGRPGKSAFIVDFNRFVGGVDHLGLEKLTLNNLVQDPSGIHEYLGYALFRAGGVPASRSGYGSVWLNGEPKGLYALLETPDNDEFLDRWFGGSGGNLYEGEYGTDLRRESIGAFDQDNGRDESRRDLYELVEALDDLGEGEDPLPVLDRYFDLELYLTYAATELFLGHWDGYAWSTNNYMIHHGGEDGLWTFLPWGIDQLFEDPLGRYAGVMRRRGPEWAPGPGGRVHALCFESPECRMRLADAYVELLARVDRMDLAETAEAARRLVEPHLLAEAEEFGDPDLTVRALEQVPRYIDDHRREIEAWLPCLAGEIVDHDGDGFDGCTLDCDDFARDVHPGAPETCNRRDDDCNGRIDDPEHCPKCIDVEGANAEPYALCFEHLPWTEARSFCQARGGDLASVHDQETFERVTFGFMEQVGIGESWIGLNDRADEGEFEWTDGSVFDFERWAPYAPRREGDDSDCVLSREFGWTDVACGERFAFVCR